MQDRELRELAFYCEGVDGTAILDSDEGDSDEEDAAHEALCVALAASSLRSVTWEQCGMEYSVP